MPDITETAQNSTQREGFAARARTPFRKETPNQSGPQTPAERLADLQQNTPTKTLTGKSRQVPGNSIPDLELASLASEERANLSTELSSIGQSIQAQREPIDPELEEALASEAAEMAPNASLGYQSPDPTATAQDKARIALETLALELGAEGNVTPDGRPTLSGEKAAELRSLIDAQLLAGREAIEKALKTKSQDKEAQAQTKDKNGPNRNLLLEERDDTAIAADVAHDLDIFRNQEPEELSPEEQAAIAHDAAIVDGSFARAGAVAQSQKWDLREDALGGLVAQFATQKEAEDAQAKQGAAMQEFSVWPHVENQPDDLYRVGYGRDPAEQEEYSDRLQAALDSGKPLVHPLPQVANEKDGDEAIRQPKEPIAVRLTGEQTRLLVTNEYPNNVQAQNQALYEITNSDSTVAVLKDTVHLDYSEEDKTYFASLDKDAKPGLDQKLTQLQAEQDRRRQPPPQERERGRQRERTKDYERD